MESITSVFKTLFWFTLFAACSSAIFAEEISLNGTWDIAFDPTNVGYKEQWQLNETFSALADRRQIKVPSAWELIEQDYEGVAFYRTTFQVPEDWADKVVRLQFGAVNYIAEVYLNDQPVGMHEGGFTPFELHVGPFLEHGKENVLTLRVQGPIMMSDIVVDGIGHSETPQWRGGLTAGIWQSVTLVASGKTYIDDVFLKPDWKDGSVTIETVLDQYTANHAEARVTVEVLHRGQSGPVTSVENDLKLRPGRTEHAWTLGIPSPRSWSPEDPFLYDIRIRVFLGDHVSDEYTARFGLREFTIKDKDFTLNGKRIYVRATFFEGLYPTSIATPDSIEMIRKEIHLAKEAGFNMIRPWRRPPVPEWLDMADEMGVLVVGSPAVECMGFPAATPHLPRRVESEIREMILRDRSRTCIVQWELFNELHRPILKQMIRPMAVLARDLDPTRLILDESGGWAFGANMYLQDEYVPLKFNDIHNYPGPLVNKRLYDGLLTIGMTKQEKKDFGYELRSPGRNVRPNLMSLVSEIGYGSLPDLPACNEQFAKEGEPLAPAYRYHKRLEEEQREVLRESGFADLFTDFSAFCREQQSVHGAANKRMLEAIRSNPRIDGYCVHALTGGDWILGAGLIDIWRNPKGEAFTATKAANQPRITSIRMIPRNVYAEKGAVLSITGINDKDVIGSTVGVRVVAESGETVLSKSFTTEWASGISSLYEKGLDTSELSGSYTVEVTVMGADGEAITRNEHDFDVFSAENLRRPEGDIVVLDTADTLTPFLTEMGISFTRFDSSTPVSVPVFVVDVKTDKATRTHLWDYIERGGTAVYTGANGVNNNETFKNLIQTDSVPVKGKVIYSKGLWNCISHMVRDHPIFEGLPVNTHMRELYGNVWAKKTIVGLGGETIVAGLGYVAYSKENDLQYSGPGESWWGSDLSIVPYGNGRCIVSQLRLVDNLGDDPVADKILFNLIQFSTH